MQSALDEIKLLTDHQRQQLALQLQLQEQQQLQQQQKLELQQQLQQKQQQQQLLHQQQLERERERLEKLEKLQRLQKAKEEQKAIHEQHKKQQQELEEKQKMLKGMANYLQQKAPLTIDGPQEGKPLEPQRDKKQWLDQLRHRFPGQPILEHLVLLEDIEKIQILQLQQERHWFQQLSQALQDKGSDPAEWAKNVLSQTELRSQQIQEHRATLDDIEHKLIAWEQQEKRNRLYVSPRHHAILQFREIEQLTLTTTTPTVSFTISMTTVIAPSTKLSSVIAENTPSEQAEETDEEPIAEPTPTPARTKQATASSKNCDLQVRISYN